MSANGVPALLDPSAEPTPQPLMTADSPAIQPTSRVPAWGIYLKGAIAIEADSILKVEYKGSARISNAPQEEGSFQSYNKVQAPYESRVQMTKSGSESDRAAFLTALETAKQSLNLYDIVMPEKVYLNANITGYSYARSARSGVTLLTVELMFEEVRQATAPVFTSTANGAAMPMATITHAKNPSGNDVVNTGVQQPQEASDAYTAAVLKALEASAYSPRTSVPPAPAAGAPSF